MKYNQHLVYVSQNPPYNLLDLCQDADSVFAMNDSHLKSQSSEHVFYDSFLKRSVIIRLKHILQKLIINQPGIAIEHY